MANIFTRIRDAFNGAPINKFNDAFYGSTGQFTTYDVKNSTYLEKGYNLNSVVYSVINQQATKTASIPYSIHKVQDEMSKVKLDRLNLATKNNLTVQQKFKKLILQNKAFDDEELMMPLKRPNPNQNWSEFHALYKTFLATIGDVYIYMLSPLDGMNAGVPVAIYLLPSQDVQIVLKDKVSFLGTEDPIKGYILIQGKQYIEFDAKNVIHIKISNPNYDESGAHLYGQSRLRAGLRNIETSNKATDLNIKTLQSGGAFGFIHGTKIPLTEPQAKELKERLVEMNNSTEDLGKIAGMSGELGFTRVSLTTAELQPFEYLNYDQKQICNVLGWSDKLLNNDAASTRDNIDNERKRVVTDNIQPDLQLLEEALNNYFLPRFKGYENAKILYDVSELPEMQDDTKALVEWGKIMNDVGALNKNELRILASFPPVNDSDMDIYTVANDQLTVSEAIQSDFNIEPTA